MLIYIPGGTVDKILRHLIAHVVFFHPTLWFRGQNGVTCTETLSSIKNTITILNLIESN